MEKGREGVKEGEERRGREGGKKEGGGRSISWHCVRESGFQASRDTA